MIKSIKVVNHLGNSVDLSLTNPWDTGLVIESITGLGPPKATVNSTDLAMGDGAVYNSARIDKRNIVFNFLLSEVFQDNRVLKTIEQVRLDTYKYFPLKKLVTLYIETDTRSCFISGYVESNEPDIFQEKEKAQVSIICPDPFFGSTRKPYKLNAFDPEFEFPFSNESVTDKLITLGEIYYSTGQQILYEGDVDSGTIVTITATGTTISPTISNIFNGNTITLNTALLGPIAGGSNSIQEGDVIVISSVRGDKYAKLYRNGGVYNILPCIPKDTSWLYLSPGINEFQYTASFGESNISISIDANTLYEGA